jgi:hypothetical protein
MYDLCEIIGIKLVDWELIVSTICMRLCSTICRQVNWCMIDNWNKIDGLRINS